MRWAVATAAWVALAMFTGCGGGGGGPAPAPAPAPPSGGGGQLGSGGGGSASGGTSSSGSGGAQQQAEGWGHLTGRIVLKGAAPKPAPINVTKDQEFCGKHNLVDESIVVGPDGGLANVVVYVRTRKVKVHPELEAAKDKPVILKNENCRFEPRVVAVVVGQKLYVTNPDPVAHNTNISVPGGGGGGNYSIPANVNEPQEAYKFEFSLQQSVPVPVACNIHPWMKGFVVIRKNPYVAVTGKDGKFEIKNLPAGELELQLWQEKAGYLAVDGWPKGRKKITIKPNETVDLGTIEVPVEKLQ